MTATSAYISKPDVTLTMLPRGGEVGLEQHRILLVGQLLSAGSASAGWVQDVPRSDADINSMFGARSHLAMMARAIRKVNKWTEVDAIALADAGGATQGTAVVTLTGTATQAKRVTLNIVSASDHSYAIDVEVGDDEAAANAKFKALIDADTEAPFTAALSTTTSTDDTLTLTAANGGTICNNWGINYLGGPVAGLAVALTGWTGGATDPTLTTIFDPVENVRYQTVIYPEAYTITYLATWIDARKNVANDVKDGVAFIYNNDSFANVKTAALARNSSEIVFLHNEARNDAYWKGPHFLEAPDQISSQMGAIRALRFETARPTADVVSSIEPLDQFGGIHMCTLPYFNTRFQNLTQPERGTGLTQAEQGNLNDNGVSVIGANEFNNAMLAGTIVTTYQNDDPGNEDDTWQYLNWRDTHSVVREYFFANIKKKFQQYRMSTGDAIPGYAIATEQLVRDYAMRLYIQLSDVSVTVKGQEQIKRFRDNMVITAKPDQRLFECYFDVPILSQAETFNGGVRFNFGVTVGTTANV